MVVIWPQHQALPASTLRQWSLDEHNVLLAIIENVEDLLLGAFGWADLPLPVALRAFVTTALERLKEIEAEEQSLENWVGLLSELRSGDSRPGAKEVTRPTLPENTD
jgi:hypothetical protein